MADLEETEKTEMIRTAYDAFNARDIDRVLSLLSPEVEWPNGWEGGGVHGRAAVRDYWTRQWAAIDPRVDPISIEAPASDVVRVLVHQVVRTKDGNLFSETNLLHTYIFCGGLIQRMEISEPAA